MCIVGRLCVQCLLQSRFWSDADKTFGYFAFFEDQQRWNATDPEPLGNTRIVVDVDLSDLGIWIFTGQFVNHRRNLAAGTTPRCPEVNQDGTVCLKDFGVEVVVGKFFDGIGSHDDSLWIQLVLTNWVRDTLQRQNCRVRFEAVNLRKNDSPQIVQSMEGKICAN